MTEPQQLQVTFGSIERRGPWTVPQQLAVRVRWGSCELDLTEATLAPGVTTFDVVILMGTLEIWVPPDVEVEVDVQSFAGHVEEPRRARVASRDGQRRVLRIVGRVKLATCEVMSGTPAEQSAERKRDRHARHHRRHAHRRERWKALHAEREMWQSERRHEHWVPWWLMSRMRRRMFAWFTLLFAAGIAVGVYLWEHPRWWHVVIAGFALSAISGAIAFRITRPLLLAIRAARDIGHGRLDTRIDPRAHGGEVRLLAVAINDMAEKIQEQLADQRQLLAAVSHELRTPLGHMRVLIETARDSNDAKALDELEKEVLVLDDLVGRLLASSRLEFGSLERRTLDLGELVADAVTAAGIDPAVIEAIGEVTAEIDPTLVRRAIANLLDNARVHGGGAVAVRIERRGGQVAIEVDDAGPGVAADRRADAFRAFVPSSAGGLGLGLALVSRIAVAHGGGAWIADRPGGGARVGFTVGVHAPASA